MSVLQRRLLLLLALLLALQAVGYLAKYLVEVQDSGRFGGDFIGFWRAAQHVRQGAFHAIYDPDHWRGVLASGGPQQLSWFVYPPFTLFGLWPLGRMSYAPAAAWWALTPLPLYFVALWALARRSGLGETEQATAAYAIVAALALPFLSANLFSGQTGAYVATFLLGAACFWSKRPILCGVCIGFMAIKPQLGLLLPFALVAAGQWRAFAAAATTVVLLVGVSAMWLGVDIWADYLAMTQLFGGFIGEGYDGVRQLVLGPYVSLLAAGAPALLAAWLQAAISHAVLGVICRVFWQARSAAGDGCLDLRLGLLAIGALLATPYALTYDTPIVMLGILPLLTRAWRDGWSGLELAALTALLATPFVPEVVMDSHIPVGLCALLATFAALMRRYHLEGSA